MVTIQIEGGSIRDINAKAYVVLLEQDSNDSKKYLVSEQLQNIKEFYAPLEDVLKERNFTASQGSQLHVTGIRDGKAVDIILLGLGNLKKANTCNSSQKIEIYRRAIGQMVRIVEKNKIPNLVLNIGEHEAFGVSPKRLAQEIASIMLQASYHFDKFITEESRKLSANFKVTLVANNNIKAEIEQGVKEGIIIGEAINRDRYFCDLPPAYFNPTNAAQYAKEIADCYGLNLTVFGEDKLKELKMGGILGVSQGSKEEAKLVFLEYKTKKAGAPTIALVGKGITFDSGGLSIKPAKAMETMKDDMAGAATVICTMQVIAQLKPDVNVVAVAPFSENMPGGAAIKPGDVITFYNGKTAEVKNTDAEGRLVLADALAYTVEKYKPQAIIDLATLTGACAHALGPFYAGLFSCDDNLVDKLNVASKKSGDRIWRLPMDDDYKVAIRSDIADICNIGNGNYLSGATTAALFLQNFVSDTPWAHLDIAGVAFGVPDMSYYRTGATGFGIRLLTDLIMTWE